MVIVVPKIGVHFFPHGYDTALLESKEVLYSLRLEKGVLPSDDIPFSGFFSPKFKYVSEMLIVQTIYFLLGSTC